MIRFGIRDAIKSVRRNFSLSIASVSCISITLLVVSLALLASFNVKRFSNDIKSDVTMVVFLNLGVTDEEIKAFENKISGIDNISPDWEVQDPETRKQMLIEEDEFWASVGNLIEDEREIFHQSYMIKVKDIEKIDETVSEIEAMPEVQVVNYGETMVGNMLSTFDWVEKIAVAVVLILIFVTIFLIVNTIKLTIFSRKQRLRADTKFYIKYRIYTK